MRLPRITAIDALLVLLSVCAAVAAGFWAASPSGGERRLSVQTPEGSFIEPLSTDGSYSFRGPEGLTILSVEGGKARISSSPCANQLCVRMTPIGEPGQWIACLPNGIFVRVEGKPAKREGGVDASSF